MRDDFQLLSHLQERVQGPATLPSGASTHLHSQALLRGSPWSLVVSSGFPRSGQVVYGSQFPETLPRGNLWPSSCSLQQQEPRAWSQGLYRPKDPMPAGAVGHWAAGRRAGSHFSVPDPGLGLKPGPSRDPLGLPECVPRKSRPWLETHRVTRQATTGQRNQGFGWEASRDGLKGSNILGSFL